MVDPKLLGIRIRTARERVGLSQEELAVAVSKDQHAISQYENGKRKLPVTDLPAFAKVLKMPLLYFFEGDAVQRDLDTTALNEFRRLPTREAQQMVITFIRNLFDLLEPYHR